MLSLNQTQQLIPNDKVAVTSLLYEDAQEGGVSIEVRVNVQVRHVFLIFNRTTSHPSSLKKYTHKHLDSLQTGHVQMF